MYYRCNLFTCTLSLQYFCVFFIVHSAPSLLQTLKPLHCPERMCKVLSHILNVFPLHGNDCCRKWRRCTSMNVATSHLQDILTASCSSEHSFSYCRMHCWNEQTKCSFLTDGWWNSLRYSLFSMCVLANQLSFFIVGSH